MKGIYKFVVLLLIVLPGCSDSPSPLHAIDEPQAEREPGFSADSLRAADRSSFSASTEMVDSYSAWQSKAGFVRPDGYEQLSAEQLEAKSNAGDKFASQKLGEMAWDVYSDRDTAVSWLKKSAEQGSVAALGQAAMMFDPDSDALMVKKQQGAEIEGSRVDAYVWARLATLRGDPDAVFGVQKHAKHLTPRQVTELELLAMEEYQQLQLAHFKQYGRGFVNSFPVDANAPHNQIMAIGN